MKPIICEPASPEDVARYAKMHPLQFVVDVYVPRKEAAIGRPLSHDWLTSLYRILANICGSWGMPSTIGEWRAEQIDDHMAKLETPLIASRFVEHRNIAYAVLRTAMDLGVVPDHIKGSRDYRGPKRARTDSKSKKLADPPIPGTLWEICIKEFFLLNEMIRSEQTKLQYEIALRNLSESIGHPATIGDLSDDNVRIMMRRLEEKGLGRKTIKERAGRINTLWTWLAKRRRIEAFPSAVRLKVPKRVPVAWTREELRQLFTACTKLHGFVGGVPKAKYWHALLAVLWDTGARITEVLAIRWEWIDFERGTIHVPAEVRKNEECDMSYRLHPDTVKLLVEIRSPTRELALEWPKHPGYIYGAYRTVLKAAGLPHGRKDKFHKIRRSVASHVQAAGLDASLVLNHSSPTITRESYLDPSICSPKMPIDVLFRPLDGKEGAS